MTLSIDLKWDSGELSDNSRTLLYVVLDAADEDEAWDAVLAEAPETVQSPDGEIGRESIKVTPLTPSAWNGTVEYSAASRKENDFEWAFDTAGGTENIVVALAQTAYAPEGETAPDYGRLINVTEDDVKGVDIVVPRPEWQEKRKLLATQVTLAYFDTLVGLTGRTNNDSFRGFDAGEVLFLGASGSRRNYDLWDVTYKFAASPNVTDLDVGETISVDYKGGWEYLWIAYESKDDAAAKRLVKRPLSANVATVYRSGDFGDLLIGTA